VLVGPIIPELGQLTTLQDLVLIDSGVKERPAEWLRHPPIPSEIGDLLNLRRLYAFSAQLFKNPTDNPALLRRIVGMLSNGTAPSSISRLTLLTDLSLRGNLLTSPLPDLSGMRDLLKLDVSSNLFSEPFPSYFGEFSELTDLCVFLCCGSFVVEIHVCPWPDMPTRITSTGRCQYSCRETFQRCASQMRLDRAISLLTFLVQFYRR
jgi:hypothetical protein